MKRHLQTLMVTLTLATTPLFAHHPAADIVDEDIYAMIDSLVADTPHADLVFDDMGRPMDTSLEINTGTLTEMENLIDDGLLDYAEMLQGEVEITITFPEEGGAMMIIDQRR